MASPPDTDAAPRSPARGWWALWVGLVLAGLVLRLPGLLSQLWLDELWTLHLFRDLGIDSPLEVFTSIHSNNNHYACTLWMYALGDHRPDWAYHLLPALAGLVTHATLGALGAWSGRRAGGDGRLEATLALALGAVCFPLVCYATESRGYTFLLCFGLLSVVCLLRYAETGRVAFAVGYGVCAALACLSHATYLFLYAGTGLWAWLVRREGVGPGPRGPAPPPRMALLLLVPAFVIGLLWLIDGRHQEYGGAPDASAPEVLAHTAAFALGPSPGWPLGAGTVLSALAAVGLLGLEVRSLRREGRPEWLLVLTAFALFPVLMSMATRPPFLHVRYFLGGLALYQLVLASTIARGVRAGGWRRAAAGVLLAVCLVGHLAWQPSFWSARRGRYVEALTHIATRAGGPTSIGSEDQMHRMMVDYYGPGVHPAISYIMPLEIAAHGGADWWITSQPGPWEGPARPEVVGPLGERYRWEATFGTIELAGTPWHVYRRVR